MVCIRYGDIINGIKIRLNISLDHCTVWCRRLYQLSYIIFILTLVSALHSLTSDLFYACSFDVFSTEERPSLRIDPISMEMATKPKGVHNRRFRE